MTSTQTILSLYAPTPTPTMALLRLRVIVLALCSLLYTALFAASLWALGAIVQLLPFWVGFATGLLWGVMGSIAPAWACCWLRRQHDEEEELVWEHIRQSTRVVLVERVLEQLHMQTAAPCA